MAAFKGNQFLWVFSKLFFFSISLYYLICNTILYDFLTADIGPIAYSWVSHRSNCMWIHSICKTTEVITVSLDTVLSQKNLILSQYFTSIRCILIFSTIGENIRPPIGNLQWYNSLYLFWKCSIQDFCNIAQNLDSSFHREINTDILVLGFHPTHRVKPQNQNISTAQKFWRFPQCLQANKRIIKKHYLKLATTFPFHRL